MGKRRLNGSTFDLLLPGDLADLAAVAADNALIDALSGRAPGTVPLASGRPPSHAGVCAERPCRSRVLSGHESVEGS